jgi:hypothetical protein
LHAEFAETQRRLSRIQLHAEFAEAQRMREFFQKRVPQARTSIFAQAEPSPFYQGGGRGGGFSENAKVRLNDLGQRCAK